MAKQVINIGTRPNSKDGDAIRDAFNKVNQNFNELYAITSGTVEGITELAQDYAAQMLVSGVHSGITVNYDDVNNRLNLSLADQISTDLTGSVFSNNSTLLVDAVNGTIPYSVISGTPTTLAGYGITDSPTDISDLSDTQNLLGQGQFAGTSLAHLELTDRITVIGSPISFTKEPNTTTTDPIDTGLELTRPVGIGAGLINIAVESSWNTETSPAGTEWNWDGWANLDDVKLRTYSNLRQALRHRIGENIVGAELVMHDIANDKYYKMQFTSWAQGPAHTGAFAYTRQLIDTSALVGLHFADGSGLVKAPKEFVDLPQIFSGDTNEYILGLADRGKHVYAFTESVIKIPTDAQVDFPIGSTIFIVTGVFATNKVVKVACTAPTTIEREGSAGALEWALKPYSTTMLIKVAENKWNLSGGMNPPSSLVNGANTVSLGSDGTLTLPGTGTIRTAFGAMSINAPTGSSNLSIKSSDTTTYMIVGNGSAGVTVGAYNWQFSNTGNLTFPDSTIQTTAWTGNFGYLTAEKDAIRGTAGYQYTFATDGYFTSSTSSESTNYFFVAYNTTNANIAAGWTVVGGTANTTVSSVTYPVAGYPGVIRVNLTAAASSTSSFYPVTVTSPDRLRVEIQPNPGTSDKFAFTTSGLTFPDSTVQTTAYTGTSNLATVARNIENEDAVEIRVNLTDSTTHTWRFGEDGDLAFPDGTTQTTAYTGDRGDLVLDAISTFGGSTVDYQASEFKFVGNNSNFPFNRIRNLLINSLMENRSTGADEDVSLLVGPLVENPVYCDLTLISDSDPSQVWQYRAAHIGRDNVQVFYRNYYARFNTAYSNDSAVIRVVITDNAGIVDYETSLHNSYGDRDDWYVSGPLGSNILAFTIADSTRSVPRSREQISNFFKSVVDNIIYNDSTEITDAETLRTRFYANIDSLVSAIGGNLYHNFRAFGSNRLFGSVPISSGTSTVPAQITFDAHRDGGRYQSPNGIPVAGAGFQVGQTITILGSTLDQYSNDPGDSLDGVHDATVTITGVDGSGGVTAYTVTGEGIGNWNDDYIGDGGDDQFDDSNQYTTNLRHQTYESDGSTSSDGGFLAYNDGFVTTDDRAVDAFGAGSKYVIAYRRGIVALFATGCTGVQWLGILGNSGRDGNGTVIEGPVKWTLAYKFDVLCVSGPEYLPEEDERFRVILRRTDEQSLVRFYKRESSSSIDQDTYLQSLHGGNFYVKGNDRLYITANRDVRVEAGDGMPGSTSGANVNITAGQGLETYNDLQGLKLTGIGGTVNINAGAGGVVATNDVIISITRANPAVVTLTSPIGDAVLIRFDNIVGMTELNGNVYSYDKISDNQLTLIDRVTGSELDTSDYGAFVSGTVSAVGRSYGNVSISARDGSYGFHGRLQLNDFEWPTNPDTATEGQYLRIKSTSGVTPVLEFASDVTASIARNIESEGDVSIRVNLTDSTTHTWRFGEDGDTEFPGSITIPGRIEGPSELILSGGTGPVYIGNGAGPVPTMPSSMITVGGSDPLVISRANGTNNPSWSFKNSGALRFPNSTEQTTAYIADNVVQVSTTGGFSDDTITYNLGVYQFKMTSGHLQIRLLAPAGIVVNAWVSTVENINEIISGNNTGLLTLDESNWVTVTGTPTAAGGDTIVATVVSTQEGKMYRVTAFRSFTSSAHMVSRETLRG
jgi:hypothetical protein